MESSLSGSSRSSSSSSVTRKAEFSNPTLLPYGNTKYSRKMRYATRNPLTNSLYRRVLVWAIIAAITYLVFFSRERDVQSVTVIKNPKTPVDQMMEAAAAVAEAGIVPQKAAMAHEMAAPAQPVKAAPNMKKKKGPSAKNKAASWAELPKSPEKLEVERLLREKEKADNTRNQDVEDDEDEDEDEEIGEQSADLPIPAQQVDGLPSVQNSDSDESEEEYRPQYSEDEDLYDERHVDGELDHLVGIRPELIAKAVANFKLMPWLQFPHLNGYFHGLKTLVEKARHQPEYPNEKVRAPFKGGVNLRRNVPKPVPYNPYAKDPRRKECFLDASQKIPAPSLYAFEGVPEHMPDPAIGAYDVLGIRDDVCFDRFGRYGPYGLGYSLAEGGTGIGVDTENAGSDEVWRESGQINYSKVDWGEAQTRCVESNSGRFRQIDSKTGELERNAKGKMDRMGIVIRLYTGFRWTHHSVLNFRALITELNLKSGGEYDLHFLLHVQDDNIPIWADKTTIQRVLDANVPKEFHGLVTVWSEAQMRLWYPGDFMEPLQNPSGKDIHGVYRSAHLPLQVFAVEHPEYNHIWNWEMDMRYLGSYYEFFDRLGIWGKKQSRNNIWERSARYYIPSYHGNWDNFSATAARDAMEADQPPVFGPAWFPGKLLLREEQSNRPVMPRGCSRRDDRAACGVGEDADLITLNPIFDTDESGWVFSLDVTGYEASPPRRCAIITASRLSRRLLLAMHEEVWRYHRSMFSEMFPTTVALHHGFKAVYAPHPLYLDRAWDPMGSSIDAAFNGGAGHSTSGSGSPFDLQNEHNHKGTSWYFNSEFAGLLWRRWLGYAQMDGRGPFGGQISKGTQRGGRDEEQAEGSMGRMCLRSMLLHPIKHEDPTE